MRLTRGARVLDRGDGTVQVGTRPGLVLAGLTAAERSFLERLEGAVAAPPRQRASCARVIAALGDAGLLEDDAATAPPACTAGVVGAGPLGLASATALARAGWAVLFDDAGPAVAAPRGTYGPFEAGATRQTAAVTALRAAFPDARADAGVARADAWVIVSHGAPLLERAVELMAGDAPHLFVCADERGAIVGPLVLPGSSPCGWCDGLGRSEADPAWPLVALQLATASLTVPSASPDVTAQAAGLVAGALAAWRAGDASAWSGATWHLTAGAPPQRRDVAAHPDCGCGAAGPIGDDLAARRAQFGRAERRQEGTPEPR